MMGGRGMMGMGGMMGRVGMGGMGGMMGGPGYAAGEADQWFIQEMIPHHDDAVAMADLALIQAEHPELKQLAQRIKDAQTKEIGQMRAWYKAWYGTDTVPAGLMDQRHDAMAEAWRNAPNVPNAPGAGFGMMGSMGAMHAAPQSIDGARPFDKAFIELMIPHHQMAVMMATHALAGAQHPEMRELLQSIISSQSAEIAQMQQWYQAWYGTPAAPAPGAGATTR
jgi:uncharacterized protein (DUF305 family)